MAGVARVPQHQRLHIDGRVHVVVRQREPGQRDGVRAVRGHFAQRAQHHRQRQQLADRVAAVPVQLEAVPPARLRPGQDTQRVAHAGDRQGSAHVLEQEVFAEGHEKVSRHVTLRDNAHSSFRSKQTSDRPYVTRDFPMLTSLLILNVSVFVVLNMICLFFFSI